MYELLEFWFENENMWFNATKNDDKLITTKFKYLLDNKEQIILKSDMQKLEKIILYDQISRHVDRELGTNYANKMQTEALKIVNNILKTGDISQSFIPKEICFILLPLRHSSFYNIMNALGIIKTLRALNKNDPYLKRFYYATIKSIMSFKNPVLISPVIKTTEKFDKFLDNFKYLLCKSCKYNTNKLIPNINKKDIIVANFVKHIQEKSITVSISGGVDSMVCAFILKKLGYNVNALMINYCNRDTSNMEVEMVSAWCAHMNISFYCRKIDEIQRSADSDREFYEKITKEIRFNSYKFLKNPVILGHNRDDCLENIFSNIKKKRSFENLTGMEHNSILFGVSIIRPMLNILKKDIILFANKYNIPYLLDSTPTWSERGKMRDILLPAINDFDKTLLDNIYDMAERFKCMSETYIETLSKNTTYLYNGTHITIKYMNCYDTDYWVMIFKNCCEKYNIKQPSTKSILNLINIIKEGKFNDRKIILSQKNYCKINQTEVMIYTNL